MCLVKVREESDVVVPYRRVVVRDQSPTRRVTRISRTSLVEQQRPSSIRIPAPTGLVVPAPQPVPVFVQPPPSPPRAPSTHHHYVEVSPHSSVTSHSDRRSDYYVHEHVERRERRERDYSPARSDYSRGDRSPRYKTYQYVEAPQSEPRYDFRRERSRSRARSRSRDRYSYEPRESYRQTRERVTIVDDDGRRSREYRN